MFRIPSPILTIPVILVGVGASGCGDFGASGSPGTTRAGEAIINGTAVSGDNIGTPEVLSPVGLCSGTMVAARWMLTATHCFGTSDPSTISASLNGGTNTAIGVLTTHHPLLDAGLVLLDRAPVNGSGKSFINRLYRGSIAPLVSQSFYTQGWGNNAITQCDNGYGGTGAGVLRSANLAIANLENWAAFDVTPNSSNQIEWTGDSGSSLYSVVAGLKRPLGVQSTAGCTQSPLAVTYIQHLRSDGIRSWVEAVTGTAPAVGSQAGFERSDDGASSVPYRDPTNHVHELCLGGACGSSWHFGDLTALAGAPNAASNVSAYIRGDSVSTVVYRTAANHIEELQLVGSTWSAGDLSSITGAIGAVGNPAGYTRSDNASAVVFRGSDNHIYELELPFGSLQWQVADLTALTGAPAAASDPVGYVRVDATSAVVFISSDGHVRELSLPANSQTWLAGDITSLTGAPAATGNPRPYTRSDGFSIVVYRGTNNHIYELRLPAPTTTWAVGDLTALTGATLAASDPAPYVRADSWSTVIYRGTNNHVFELGLAPGSVNWQVGDLTALTGALTATNTPSGYVRADGVSAINYTTSDNHVRELSLTGSSWSARDLTAAAGGP